MEEFAYNLREHIIGLNLGRWDYMASLIHFNLEIPTGCCPTATRFPTTLPFFQNLRELMPEICHNHGILAIGGMTALYPSREDAELNARALAVLEKDKKNEADCLMDGAWTGHPDQNEIAVAQFPFPNQLLARPQNASRYPDLRPLPRASETNRERDARRRAHRDPLSPWRAQRTRSQPARRLHGRPGDRPDLPSDDRAARAASRSGGTCKMRADGP